VRAFSEIAPLYIADGHHRSASASIVRRELAQVNAAHTGDESYNGLLSVIFPHDELRIMPYNRVILESPLSDDEILSRLRNSFSIEKAQDGVPAASGEFRLFVGGSWFSMRAIAAPKAQSRGDALDVSVLQSLALEPVFGIRDPRTDKKIDFVGGIRGTAELEKRVRDGSARCAFSLFPVGMEDLFGIADGGEIMPPKSTWFEPKLRSGVVVHSFLKDLRNDADYERFATTGNPT
ncbi:MAG: DUF1015 domain-containing protein, partial [Deltaproteobacteria bacterium]|nr:DUF1015 domain-containing protein [Deltaproteobacteria bacterium]